LGTLASECCQLQQCIDTVSIPPDHQMQLTTNAWGYIGDSPLYVLHEGLIQRTVLLVYPIKPPLSSVQLLQLQTICHEQGLL
jgi:hypothetical protein